MPDPAKVVGSDAEKSHAFRDAALYLKQRIDFLTLIPIAKLEQAALEQRTQATTQD